MNPESKLVLGTVNFGMKYGYLGDNTQLEKNSTFEILDYAIEENIYFFDTAQDYGESEKLLGEFIRTRSHSNINIVTKCRTANVISNPVADSLSRLRLQKLYAVLFHDFNGYFRKPELIRKLQAEKEVGRVGKIGFSLYLPRHLELLLRSDIDFEIVQVPFSIFDRRFEPYFPELKERGVEIHTRSVFLNGLFFQNPKTLGSHFDRVKPAITEIRRLSETLGVSTEALCLNFVNQDKFINKIVVGVRSIEDLRSNSEALSIHDKLSAAMPLLNGLRCDEQDILHPHEWLF